jgi:hypothetical protein
MSTLALAIGLGVLAAQASAEPIFLSRQYARCTTCHFSPTGGGLLTPYGRSLSREELSTTGKTGTPGGEHEHSFLWGALPATGPVSLGIDLRPAHLDLDAAGSKTTRDFFMTASLQAAYRQGGFTAYGEFGRQPRSSGTEYDSFEHWVGYQSSQGLGFRVGRFLPAYGVRFADHTAFNRAPLGFDSYDQLYAVELSQTTDRHLLQLTASPGLADAIVDDDGRRAFTAAGRFQLDLGARRSLVVSGQYRAASDLTPRTGSGGLAFGFAPTPRFSIWTEADARFEQGVSGAPGWVLVNETGFEVHRGIWLRFSPQLRTEPGDASAGVVRLAFTLDLLPRTHVNVGASYYHDKLRQTDLTVETFLIQLHLYL